MTQVVHSPRDHATAILEEAFLTVVNEDTVDSSGVFYINYRGDDDNGVGRWIAGRNESDQGLDYVYRQRFDNEENESGRVYVYSNDDGWANTGVLLGEQDGLVQLFEWVDNRVSGIETEYSDRVDQALSDLRDYGQEQRRELTLDDVIEAVQRSDFEFLQDTVAPEGDDIVEFWKLLFSYNPAGEPVENESVSIEYRDDTVFFARAERQYTSGSETKEYPMGLVVGIDDTPDTFFTHRIERDDALDNPQFEWSLQDIRQRMGFHVDYTDLTDNRVPLDQVTRLQGNLAVVPYHFETAKQEYYNVLVEEMKKYLHYLYGEFYRESESIDIERHESVEEDDWRYRIGRSRSGEMVIIGDPPTPVVKSLQRRLGVDEENVRAEQERRGIQRLSANLRRNIVEDLYLEQFCDWLFTEATEYRLSKYQDEVKNRDTRSLFPNIRTARNSIDSREAGVQLYNAAVDFEEPLTRTTVHKIAEATVDDVFAPKSQTNAVLGNHSVLANPGRIHPWDDAVDWRDRSALEQLIVPEDALVICGHDEHQSRAYTFPKGVYEFRFLDGLETDLFR